MEPGRSRPLRSEIDRDEGEGDRAWCRRHVGCGSGRIHYPGQRAGGFRCRQSPCSDDCVNQVRRGTIDDLIVGAHVEIHGQAVGGTLQAVHISFEGNFEFESNVATIDIASQTLTLVGLSGMTVHINNETAIDGEGDLRRFEDIRVGDHLKIDGRPAGSDGLLAEELERGAPAAGIKLQGPVRSVLEPVLIIAGVSIDTSGIPNNGFTGSDGSVIGRTAFFKGLVVGNKVSLKGTWTGSGVNWTGARRSGGE